MNKSFKHYLETLEKLSLDQSLIQEKSTVVFLSGASTLEHAELSRVGKEAVLEWERKGAKILPTNFPYNEGFRKEQPTYPHIIKASFSNICYYIYTWKHKTFRKELKRHLSPLFLCDKVVIIALSSGLHLLSQIIEEIKIKKQTRITIIALGPVSHKRFISESCELIVIKGKRDWYSRILDTHPVDQWVDCNHYDYLKEEQVREYIGRIIEKNKD